MLKIQKEIIKNIDAVLEVASRIKENLIDFGFKDDGEKTEQVMRSISSECNTIQGLIKLVDEDCSYYYFHKKDFEEDK